MMAKRKAVEMKEEQRQMLSAAIRHTRDAERLLMAQGDFPASPDQAWHLAGFGLECIRKACLFERWGDKLLGHDFDSGGEEVLSFLLALEPRAWRYPLRDWEQESPLLKEWTPEARSDSSFPLDGTKRSADRECLFFA